MSGLRLAGISRSFGSRQVLHEVDLTVRRGEIVGFIGGNGAGKTTTMRLILGLLAADRGEVTWDERPITAQDRRRIGYMPEERGLYPQMAVREQVIHFALLEGHAGRQAREVADSLIAALGLSGRESALVQDLSLGNQQRVQLAVSLVGNPELLVLDEPFSGLDPVAVETMAGLIREQAARGVGVLFSSHQIDLVERVSDRVCVLDRGRVVASGSVAELQKDDCTRWRLTFQSPSDAPARRLANLGEIAIVDTDRTTLTLTVPGAGRAIPDDVLRVCGGHGGLRGIEPIQRSLTEILTEQFISAGRGSTPSPAPTVDLLEQAGAAR